MTTEDFADMVALYQAEGYAFAYWLCKNHSVAMDIVQDAFIKCFLKVSNYDKDRPFLPWFCTIVRNTYYDYLRKRRFESVDSYEKIEQTGSGSFEESIDDRLVIGQMLSYLVEEEREAIYLRFIEQMSYQEIASVMSISVSDVTNRLHRGLKKLKGLKERFFNSQGEIKHHVTR